MAKLPSACSSFRRLSDARNECPRACAHQRNTNTRRITKLNIKMLAMMNEVVSVAAAFIESQTSRFADLLHANGGFFSHSDVHIHVGFGGDLAAVFGGADDADAVDALGQVDWQTVGGDGAACGIKLRFAIDGPAFDFADGDSFAAIISGEGAELHLHFAILRHGAGASVDDLGGKW